MSGLKIRLTLFLGLIVGPAGILTFLSLRAALDEQQSTLADVRQRVPALRASVDDRLAALVASLDEPVRAPASGFPEILFRFSLDSLGSFVQPRVLPPVLTERSAAFTAALQEGERLEFGQKRSRDAATAYRQALDVAGTRSEEAEALNALGRVLLAARDTTTARVIHERLQDFPNTLDADGAHPLTLSTLRQVEGFSGDSAGVRTVAQIGRWAERVLSNEIPLHPGIRHAVARFDRALRRESWRIPFADRLADLRDDLQRITDLADFALAYDQLLETAVVRPEGTYFCGTGPDGATMFAIARPTPERGAVGVRIDLQRLATAVLATDTGQSLRDAGFQVTLFDTDKTGEFERRYGGAVRLVAAASNSVYRLNLGVYSQDQPFVFEHYRNRSVLWVGGIALLAAAIGLGVWVVIRETTREVETARLRAEFVANVSHELRTPLTAIRMYAETLLFNRVRSDDQRQDYLRTMMRESQRLSRMVGNILDFSRLESGRKSFDFVDSDVGELVAAAIDEFRPLFDEQGFSVHLDIHPDLPSVPVDREALTTVVANLLSNAVKYSTDDRRIELGVRAQGPWLEIDVADRGIGIPASEQKRVFDKYRRASNAEGRATGTGLGLALVESIVRSHGGSIAVESREEGGSRFRLRLPLSRS